jgi:DNA-binding response OmpR family regulator
MPADSTGKAEARQIELGADCVMRDPVRIEVLMQYLEKFQRNGAESTILPSSPEAPSYTVADVQVLPHEQKLLYAGKSLHIAPQEVALLRMLARSPNKVVTYPALYEELLHRKFAGDTTNCRVLLGKVCASFKQLGVELKAHIQVIPKSGYLYSAALSHAPAIKAPRPKIRQAQRVTRRSRP